MSVDARDELTLVNPRGYTRGGRVKGRTTLTNKLNFMFAGLALATLTGCSGGGQMGSPAAMQSAPATSAGSAQMGASRGGSSTTGNVAQNSPGQPMTAPNPGMIMMSPNPSTVTSAPAPGTPMTTASDPAADPQAAMAVASDPAADPAAMASISDPSTDPAAMVSASDPPADPAATISIDPSTIGAADPPTDPAPEPGSLWLAGIGLLAAAGALRLTRSSR